MINQLSARNPSRTVPIETNSATIAAPSASPPVDIFATWRTGGNTPRHMAYSIDKGSTAGAGTTTIDAGAYYVGHDAEAAKWRYIGKVNGGEAVALTDDVGFEEILTDAAVFIDIRVVGVLSGTTPKITSSATPIEVAG